MQLYDDRLRRLPTAWADTIRNREPDRQVTCWPDPSAPDKVAYLLAWRPPAEALRGLANLKLIFSLGAGVDGLIAQADLPDVPIVRIISDDSRSRCHPGPRFRCWFLHPSTAWLC